MENETVVTKEVLETVDSHEVDKKFPSDEMLNSMGVTREEFEKKVEENSKLSHDEKMESLDKMIEENKKLNEEIKQMSKEVERTNLITTLANEGLKEFQGLFDFETTEEKVEFLKKVKNEILVGNSYQPKESNGTQDAYSQAIQNGDVKNAISFKFSNLFKK